MDSNCTGKGGPTWRIAFWVAIGCGSCVAPARGHLGAMTFDPVRQYSLSSDRAVNGEKGGDRR